MSELISRQEAIEALIDAGIVNYEATGDGNGMIHAINVIKGLPSVEPKKGKWILRDYGERIVHICSECGVHVPEPHADDYKFCPNCGAKMEVDHD